MICHESLVVLNHLFEVVLQFTMMCNESLVAVNHLFNFASLNDATEDKEITTGQV
jgi:hypothetical protein